ncbi:MAG TPA: tyrosine-type recombinase/integrase, partial [Roseiflexaceae bacterium]|nr:tyrosine-type recombinase/integrase [Roseiflexaceae bacterium]
TTYLASRVAEALALQRQRQLLLEGKAGAAWESRGLVFTDTHGRPLDPTRMSQRFKQLAKRAGLPPEIHFHSLRHTCSTFLIKQGVHQRTVMEILGHRSLRTAERYGQVLPEVTRDALGKHGQRLARREVKNEL